MLQRQGRHGETWRTVHTAGHRYLYTGKSVILYDFLTTKVVIIIVVISHFYYLPIVVCRSVSQSQKELVICLLL